MRASAMKKLLGAAGLAGLMAFSGAQVASAQTGSSDSSSSSTTAPSDGSSTAPAPSDNANCPNMGTSTAPSGARHLERVDGVVERGRPERSRLAPGTPQPPLRATCPGRQ